MLKQRSEPQGFLLIRGLNRLMVLLSMIKDAMGAGSLQLGVSSTATDGLAVPGRRPMCCKHGFRVLILGLALSILLFHYQLVPRAASHALAKGLIYTVSRTLYRTHQ